MEPGGCPPALDVTGWLNALSVNAIAEEPGPEWLSVSQIQELIGRKRAATQEYLLKAIEAGAVETKRFVTRRSDGVRMHANLYRIKV